MASPLYPKLEEIVKAAKLSREYGWEVVARYYELYRQFDGFEEAYQGIWNSEEDFAYELAHGLYSDEKLGKLEIYIDWEKYARDLFIGDYSSEKLKDYNNENNEVLQSSIVYSPLIFSTIYRNNIFPYNFRIKLFSAKPKARINIFQGKFCIPMSKKKNKNEIAKRRLKAKQNKGKNKKTKKTLSRISNDFLFSERPSLSEIEAPKGFYAVSTTQAMMKYAEPIMEMMGDNDIESMNAAMQVCQALWNYQINLEREKKVSDRLGNNLFDIITSTLGMNDNQAADFIREMVERKNYLLPPEIQPKASMTMFLRKEVSNLITKFNYDKLNLSSNPIPTDSDDEGLIDMINRMDSFIMSGNDYDEWEDHYFSMEEKCKERFYNWLTKKGQEEYKEDFVYYMEIYLNFIYRYGHEDLTILKNVKSIYFEEFFFDHIIRKVIIDPHEYIYWPPTLKLFYQFLSEKKYIQDSTTIINEINKIEPDFIDFLQERYS